MNSASIELGLLLLRDPPYSAVKLSELLELASSRETVCSAANLTRLERLAGSIASDNAEAALDLAARLESAHGDCGCCRKNSVSAEKSSGPERCA